MTVDHQEQKVRAWNATDEYLHQYRVQVTTEDGYTTPPRGVHCIKRSKDKLTLIFKDREWDRAAVLKRVEVYDPHGNLVQTQEAVNRHLAAGDK